MNPIEFETAVGKPLSWYNHQCHSASIALVKSGYYPVARVARGTCHGVGGQHSWVVLSNDCYDKHAEVVDPTLWSYDPEVTGVWQGRANVKPHVPHRAGSIFKWGKPRCGDGPIIELASRKGLSADAELFLEMLGPLDRYGWALLLSSAPVEGWPASEILTAADNTPTLTALIPIDSLGMLTDLNPGGLYLP